MVSDAAMRYRHTADTTPHLISAVLRPVLPQAPQIVVCGYDLAVGSVLWMLKGLHPAPACIKPDLITHAKKV